MSEQTHDPDDDFLKNLRHVTDEFLGAGKAFGVDFITWEPLQLVPIPFEEIDLTIYRDEIDADRRDQAWQDFLRRAFERRQWLRLNNRIK